MPSSPSRTLPLLTLVKSNRSAVDILQELALKAPKEFAAVVIVAQGILDRLNSA